MLFSVTWEFVDTSEEGSKRALELFAKWQPPETAAIQGFYANADNSGGLMIVDVPDHGTVAKLTATWVPWLHFIATPILPIEEGTGLAGAAVAWRAAN